MENTQTQPDWYREYDAQVDWEFERQKARQLVARQASRVRPRTIPRSRCLWLAAMGIAIAVGILVMAAGR
jgi:hypothetical protein